MRLSVLLTVAGSTALLASFGACGGEPDPVVPGDAAVEGASDASSSDVVDDGDATADAAFDAGPTALLTVVVENRLKLPVVPVAGADVVFYDTTGDVFVQKTDVTGHATATLHDGATITVVNGTEYTDYVELTSVLGVGLGETIAITDEPYKQAPDAQLQFKSDPPPLANGVEYRFYTGQGGSGGHFVPNTYTTQTAYPLVDGTGFRFLGFAPAAFQPTITPTKYAVCAATQVADGGVTSCTVPANGWADVAVGPLALVGTADPSATKWTWDLGHANGLGLYPMIHVDVPPTNAALPASYSRVPTNAAAFVHTEGTLWWPSNGKSFHTRRAANQGTVTEDFARYLPRLTGATVSGPLDAPTIAFTATAALPTVVGSHWIEGSTSIDGGVRYTDWVVYHRTSKSSVTLPKLPAALASFLPTSWDIYRVALFDSAEIPWETIRTLPRAQQQRILGLRSAYPLTAFDARTTVYTK